MRNSKRNAEVKILEEINAQLLKRGLRGLDEIEVETILVFIRGLWEVREEEARDE